MTDDGGVADGDASRVDGAVEQLHDETHGVVGLGAATRQPLRQDDAALLLHLLRGDGQAAGPVGEDGQRRVDHQGVGTRQLQLVDGLIERGVGVEVLAKLGALRLQETDDAVAGEVLRTVEGQMLEEVGQSLLVVALVDGARLDEQAVDGLTSRRLIGIDIIRQSVLQTPHAQLWVTGKLLC